MKKVLVVDDSPIARKMLVKSLSSLDWQIEQASSGEEALVLLETGGFDLVFLDLTMPGMEGPEVLSEIKNRNIDVVSIVVSADIQKKMQEKVISLGAFTMIQKPVRVADLVDTLKSRGVL